MIEVNELDETPQKHTPNHEERARAWSPRSVKQFFLAKVTNKYSIFVQTDEHTIPRSNGRGRMKLHRNTLRVCRAQCRSFHRDGFGGIAVQRTDKHSQGHWVFIHVVLVFFGSWYRLWEFAARDCNRTRLRKQENYWTGKKALSILFKKKYDELPCNFQTKRKADTPIDSGRSGPRKQFFLDPVSWLGWTRMLNWYRISKTICSSLPSL